MKLLSSVLPAQESYACDVEGVDADFLLLMAGVVKSGVCSKARCVVEDIGMLRLSCNFWLGYCASKIIRTKGLPM